MLISDVSVRRPVFAAVISLILVIIGLMSVRGMQIREYPDIQRPIVSISTTYRGAASDIVERRVTQVLEDQLAGSAVSGCFGYTLELGNTILPNRPVTVDPDAAGARP